MAPFLAMAKLKQAWLCASGLTKKFHFMARFLAMAKLKQAWLCSFGLTKTFVDMYVCTNVRKYIIKTFVFRFSVV